MLLATSHTRGRRAYRVALSLPLALALAFVGYSLCGYAFQFGGIGLIRKDPAFQHLLGEWSPLDPLLGPGWGLMGVRGFLFDPRAASQAELNLFASQLPFLTATVLIPLTTLYGRIPKLGVFFIGLLAACLCYPLGGNWLWGGGWLTQLGKTLSLGRGFIDQSGSSLLTLGGWLALAGLAAFRQYGAVVSSQEPAELPQPQLPLHASIGALLALLGWLAWLGGQPFGPQLSDKELLTCILWVGVPSILGAFLYGWLARGELDLLLCTRALVASLIAGGPGLLSLSTGQLATIGLLSGFFLAPAMYLVEFGLRLDDQAAAVSTYGFAGAWGILALGLFSIHRQNLEQLGAQALGLAGLLVLSGLIPWVLSAILAQAYAFPAALKAEAQARAQRLLEEKRKRERLLYQRRRRHWQTRLAALYQRGQAFLGQQWERLQAKRKHPPQEESSEAKGQG